jgi:23S rRNA (guanosine2251-2'-O)-methyltransferase
MKNNKKQHWIYGKHAVLAASQNKNREIHRLLITKQTLDALKKDGSDIHKLGLKCDISSSSEIGLKVGGQAVSHQGIALQTSVLQQPSLEAYLSNIATSTPSTIVILDHVADPQNIGSIMRTASAFNVGAVIVATNNSPGETSSMVKAAAGAFECLPLIAVTNIVSAIGILKKHQYWVLGMDHNAPDVLHKTKIDFHNAVLILGSEEDGIRPLVRTNCDVLLKIQMLSDKMESINVSNAAAIALHALITARN